MIGGHRVTARAGIYPKPLARALVRGLERQFDMDFAVKEVKAVSVDDDAEEELAFEGTGFQHLHGDDDGSDVDVAEEKDGKDVVIPAGVRAAVLRLHQTTGHRSGKRLARALAIAGALNLQDLATQPLQKHLNQAAYAISTGLAVQLQNFAKPQEADLEEVAWTCAVGCF